ncbi:hypothetical protein ACJX0J_038820, partial [Zea mays]
EINAVKFCSNKFGNVHVVFFRGPKGSSFILKYGTQIRVAQVELCGENDMFKWDLSVTGLFSVPLKIKIFMWYLIRGVVLTKDNLLRRNWHGDRKNDLVFDKKPIGEAGQVSII